MFIGIRPLEPGDEDAVLRIFESRADYFEAATGYLPGPADMQSLFHAVPAGATDAQKRLLAIESDRRLAGVVDAIADFPEAGTASVGLFLLDRASPLHGFGLPVASLVGERAIAEGISTVHVGCPLGWVAGESLLDALGFRPVGSEPVAENRVIRPNEPTRTIRRWVGRLTPPPSFG